VSNRELVVLGTASQAPTRFRNHNGYFLRWDDEGILFDPGEGAQRQMILAGVSSARISRICITHFHGDHCLGLPGVIQRMSLDGATKPVDVYFSESGGEYLRRLRRAAIFDDRTALRLHGLTSDRFEEDGADFRILGRALDHSTPTVGWRIEEYQGVRMLPERLKSAGIEGPDVGKLQHEGSIAVGGRTVALDEMSEPRPGQSAAFVMDTRICDAAFELAERADLLVCESTFLSSEEELAHSFGHLTAAQAARIAAESGARRLVLTHFSQRHPDTDAYLEEASEIFDDVVAVRDLDVVPVPPRL
jgi:ribonuclease Z